MRQRRFSGVSWYQSSYSNPLTSARSMAYNQKRLTMKRLILLLLGCVLGASAQQTYDLVVYGGTAGGGKNPVRGGGGGLEGRLLGPGGDPGGMATRGPSRPGLRKEGGDPSASVE